MERGHAVAPDTFDGSAVDQVSIFDTTLRDGEQAPGFSMDRRAKLRMARMLESLGVDVLEAGFPQASPEDFAAVAEIAATLTTTTACALARCTTSDIDCAARALGKARRSRIHVFIATSPLHREHKLGMSRAAVLDAAVAGVERARNLADEVEFSAEDAMRTELDFLVEVFSAAAAAGATVLNAPDTVGYMTPDEIAQRFSWLVARVKRDPRVIFSTHCHNDLGLAVANSLAAVCAGARQVECTMNGIGERAGNASLEEIVMAMKVRRSRLGAATRIHTRRLYPASRLLSRLTGQPVPRNKAIVGANAFAHEAGIHQHGMLKHPETYEIMRPEDVGIAATTLVMGKHSGRAALRNRLHQLGHDPDEAALDAILVSFKALADRRGEVSDEEIDALARGHDPDAQGPWRLLRLDTSSHLAAGASASVHLAHDDGRQVAEAALGVGPVHAVVRAIERATALRLDLTRFQLNAVGHGADAQGEARLAARHESREWNGHGVSADVVEAAARAALAILNRIARQSGRSTSTRPEPARSIGVAP